MTTTLTLARGLVWTAAAVLVAAYAGVCLAAGTAWPWGAVVHEDGRRTLLETVLYYEHALRELPLDLLLAMAIAGAVLHVLPTATAGARRRRRRPALAAVALAGAIVGGALVTGGAAAVGENLLQMPTRSGAPLVVGAHWRYHLLDRLACMLLAFAVAGLATGGGRATGGRAAPAGWLFGAALGAYGAVTVLFGLTVEPFVEAVFLGHQARELATHGLVTVPLGLGVTLACAASVPLSTGAALRQGCSRAVLAAGITAAAIGVYLAAGVVVTGAAGQGQTSDMATLVFPHVFEHALTYAVVATAAPALYLWRSVR